MGWQISSGGSYAGYCTAGVLEVQEEAAQYLLHFSAEERGEIVLGASSQGRVETEGRKTKVLLLLQPRKPSVSWVTKASSPSLSATTKHQGLTTEGERAQRCWQWRFGNQVQNEVSSSRPLPCHVEGPFLVPSLRNGT